MAVVIRLQRAGSRHRAFYRIVVTDSRKPRDGAFLEKVGYYDPLPAQEVIHLEHERIAAWMSKGAQPTEAVRGLMHRLARRGRPEPPPSAEDTASPPEPAAQAAGSESAEASGGEEVQPES